VVTNVSQEHDISIFHFSLEDGGNMYLPDTGTHLPDSMVLYPRKPKTEILTAMRTS
jgi:hypothetical protein